MANKSKQLLLSDAAETAAEGNRPVFIDTSLGTRLAINLSLTDTVSDFKRKIEKEHTLSFSNFGDIVVHALNVKRRGQFYRLSDSLLVKEAFGFVTENWFLSVEASIVEKNLDERPENTHSLDGVDLLINDGGDLSQNRRKFEIEILKKPGESLEERSKKRKRKTERNGDLHEPAVISQPVLGNSKRSGNDVSSSDTRKSKKGKTSNCKIDQVSNDDGKKRPSASGEISVNLKNLNAVRDVGDQELLAVDTRHKADETEEEKELAPEEKMETSEDHIHVDVESNRPIVIKQPEDLEKEVGVYGNKDIGTSSQAERPDKELKKSDSDRKQLNPLDSTFPVESETNRKALDVSVGLVDEIGSVVLSNTGKKSKSQRKKNKGLDETVVTKSSGPDFQGTGTKVSAEPLAAKCNERNNENSMNEEIKFPPKIGNEVKNVENKEKEPVKRRVKKKQNSEKNLSDVLEKEDVVPENLTPPAVTVEAVASSKTKKKGKKRKVESGNFGAQNVRVTDEPKSTDKEGRDEADTICVIRQGCNETEPKTCALKKMEASKDLQTGMLEQGVSLKNNDDSVKVQSINEVKAKDVDSSSGNLAGENTSSVVLPTDVGKKSKKSKKTKGLGENLPLGVKPDLVVEEEPLKKRSRERQKSLLDEEVGPESEKKDKVQNVTVFAEPKSVTSKSSKAKLHSLDGGEKSDEAKIAKSNDPMEVSGPGNKITLAKPLPNIVTSSIDVVAVKKKVPKAKTDSVQTSSNVRSPTKPNGKERIIGYSSTVLVQEALLLEEKSGESTVHPEKKLTKASNNKSAKINLVSKETRKPNVVSQSAVTNKSLSDAKVLLKSLEPKKRLVSTPGSIFKDDSGVSSDDDDEGSDTSTRTPSNYSSDYSDGEESNANSKSLQKGAKSVDKRSILKSCASAGKDITFDTIIRSSSRYKKTIVTASELQLNDESQQVDFVPDSQPVQ